MKDIYNEEEINKFVDTFAQKSVEKLKEDLLDRFYSDVQSYINEHYSNFKDKVERDLITSICEQYTKNPSEYKFKDLREKLFNENKEEIIKLLSDEAIENSIENIVEEYTFTNYHFNWRWKDGLARFILKNFDKFKDDERVNEWIGRDLQRSKDRINWLENKLREVSNILDD